MRIVFFLCCAIILCSSSYSQKKTIQENEVFKTCKDYSSNTPSKFNCSVKKNANKKVDYLKVGCNSDSSATIWGISYEGKTWIKNKRKRKFYELKEDSLGLYYDIYNDEDVRWTTIAGGVVSGVVTGVAVFPVQKPEGGILNVILRYRQDSLTNEFYPYGFPNLKPSKVIYYFTKYSKNETPVNIEVNKKTISLKKGSYYEEILPARPAYTKQGVCFEKTPIPFIVKILPTRTTVILFSRNREGLLENEEMNQHMVIDFLKKQDRLEKINP